MTSSDVGEDALFLNALWSLSSMGTSDVKGLAASVSDTSRLIAVHHGVFIEAGGSANEFNVMMATRLIERMSRSVSRLQEELSSIRESVESARGLFWTATRSADRERDRTPEDQIRRRQGASHASRALKDVMLASRAIFE